MTIFSPSRLVHIAIEPRRRCDRSTLARVLTALADDEPGLDVAIDEDTGRIVLAGDSEERLDAALALLQGRHGLELNAGTLQIAYRETLARRVEMDFTHRKRVAGGGFEFARVKFVFAPGAASSFRSSLPEQSIPGDLVAGVERGIDAARRAGSLAGFPVVDVAVTLVDGAYHEADSTPAVFEKAATSAFRQAQCEVGVLLEPVMRVEVVGPESHIRAMRGDLLVRRGEVDRATARGDGSFAIAARVPLANLLGYPAHLHRLTDGEGRIAMTFSHFAPVDPPEPPDFPAASALRIA